MRHSKVPDDDEVPGYVIALLVLVQIGFTLVAWRFHYLI